MDCRVISAFTRVFDALCPAMTKGIDRSPTTSPAGLTRGSIVLRKNFPRRGWIAGSSPAMTKGIGRSPTTSPAGLAPGSIVLPKDFLRSGWIAGSSPAMTKRTLFLLAALRHAGAVRVDLVVAPDVLLILPGLGVAVLQRLGAAAAHPFAALREARRRQRRSRKPHGKRGKKRADPHPLSFLRESSP